MVKTLHLHQSQQYSFQAVQQYTFSQAFIVFVLPLLGTRKKKKALKHIQFY